MLFPHIIVFNRFTSTLKTYQFFITKYAILHITYSIFRKKMYSKLLYLNDCISSGLGTFLIKPLF